MRTRSLLVGCLSAVVFGGWASAAEALVLTVNSPGDAAGTCTAESCSLRQAIAASNASGGRDEIVFLGVTRITPTNPLPDITDPVDLVGDGRVQLSGELMPFPSSGLTLSGPSNLVRGLSITDYRTEIDVQSSGNTITANLIGVGDTGDFEAALLVMASGNVIDGNTIAVDTADPPAPDCLSPIPSCLAALRLVGNDNVVIRNRIGVDPGGATTLGRSDSAVGVSGAGNEIGRPGEGNIIGNATGDGIDVLQGANVRVAGNAIGVGAGNADVGGRHGIRVRGRATVGGATSQHANEIAGWGGAGVWVTDTGGQTTISGNRIRDNGGLGIDLGSPGHTENDAPDDEDTGANGLQNHPVLGGVTVGGLTATVTGALDSRPEVMFRIDVYHSPRCDPSRFGEGTLKVGEATVKDDQPGAVPFAVEAKNQFGPPFAEGAFTATATNLSTNETSEFSACVSPPVETGGSLAGGRRAHAVTVNLAATGGVGGPFTWEQVSGTLPPGVALSSAGALTGIPTAAGTFDFGARATDAEGNQGTGSFTVVVEDNRPPALFTGGPYFTPEGSGATLTAAAADPDGDAVSFAWDLVGKGEFAPSPFGSTLFAGLPQLGGDGPATKTVGVRASDGIDAVTGTATVAIVNMEPTVSVRGPAAITLGDIVDPVWTFTASDPSAADQAGQFGYAIDWDGNGRVDERVKGGASLRRAHEFTTAGTRTVRVTATDKDGATSAAGTTRLVVAEDAELIGDEDPVVRSRSLRSGCSVRRGVIARCTIEAFNPADLSGAPLAVGRRTADEDSRSRRLTLPLWVEKAVFDRLDAQPGGRPVVLRMKVQMRDGDVRRTSTNGRFYPATSSFLVTGFRGEARALTTGQQTSIRRLAPNLKKVERFECVGRAGSASPADRRLAGDRARAVCAGIEATDVEADRFATSVAVAPASSSSVAVTVRR